MATKSTSANPPLLVTGRVLDVHGQPVAGARLLWLAAPVALPDVALLSGADGSFTLSVPAAGAYRLRASSDGLGQADAVLQVGAGGAKVTLRLPR